MNKPRRLPSDAEIEQTITRIVSRDFPGMSPWLAKFLSAEREEALRVVKETLLLDPQGSYWLLEEVLCHCYKASTFQDLDRKQRTQAGDFLTGRKQARPAIKKLRKLLKQYPQQVGWVIARAHLMQKNISVKPGISLVQAFDEFLACLDESFQDNVLGAKSGSFLHRYRSGPLLYSAPLDSHRSQGDGALNGLVFALAFHFRRATNSQQGTSWNNGQLMPRNGKPCTPLIARYARLVFPSREKDTEEDKINDRLKRLGKYAALTSWPQ